ncbi:MAG: hypothetical protein GTO22_10545 [Gemmatimonadales bacterium]|nr:hypothetical protein [Gemmatimonadales bacterium]
MKRLEKTHDLPGADQRAVLMLVDALRARVDPDLSFGFAGGTRADRGELGQRWKNHCADVKWDAGALVPAALYCGSATSRPQLHRG